jgi:hypothetical protein
MHGASALVCGSGIVLGRAGGVGIESRPRFDLDERAAAVVIGQCTLTIYVTWILTKRTPGIK